MMRVDAYTHFLPTRFFKEVMSAGNHKDIGKRMMGVPSIYDVKVRLKVVDKFKDYAQVLSYPMPPFELMTKDAKQTEEYAKIVNDGFAELCAKHPDHFPGWVAQAPMAAPDCGVREAARAKRLPFPLWLFAILPDSSKPAGQRPWSGVCLLEKNQRSA